VVRQRSANQYGVFEPELDPESLDEYPPDGQFSYYDGVAKEGGLHVRTLPETIYSALIMGHLVLDHYESPKHDKLPEAHTCSERVHNCCVATGNVISDLAQYARTFALTDLPLLLSWAIAVLTQFALAYYLHNAVVNVNGDLGPTCLGSDALLRVLALSAFVALAMSDAMETWSMHLWLSQFQTVSNFGALRFKRFSDAEADAESARLASNVASNSSPNLTSAVKHVITQPVTGITCMTKVYFYFAAIFSKFIAMVAVLFSGSGAVLRSDNNFDLILNSVAASFILEIDNFAYALLVPETMKRAWSSLPPLGIPKASVPSLTLVGAASQFYVAIGILALIDIFLWQYWWCNSAYWPNTPLWQLVRPNNTFSQYIPG